jgi:hypothetical protein
MHAVCSHGRSDKFTNVAAAALAGPRYPQPTVRTNNDMEKIKAERAQLQAAGFTHAPAAIAAPQPTNSHFTSAGSAGLAGPSCFSTPSTQAQPCIGPWPSALPSAGKAPVQPLQADPSRHLPPSLAYPSANFTSATQKLPTSQCPAPPRHAAGAPLQGTTRNNSHIFQGTAADTPNHQFAGLSDIENDIELDDNWADVDLDLLDAGIAAEEERQRLLRTQLSCGHPGRPPSAHPSAPWHAPHGCVPPHPKSAKHSY